ncbi:Two-component response regulator, SAPR family, consists of REC, wHTH and BTAD domains [Halolactibacillus halophilus]|uniref:Two-component response regulator, SAPR family, consists of REC, wHTH and BTAD domains n=1 Tax=Halolactibacillus halophilus TaxID=306540 RepID=A0A1I5PX11_9BACI|nr:response regulator [Halolactibacillus halophilus]GEM02239.1 hypothetical protein HHA03_17710 [Halolactibacillus halophilus]SFP38544.1 Two-component response regulator, SAPR family, consists of REC, wHTH and BTAD domains [Halolactibacillus halophilus]
MKVCIFDDEVMAIEFLTHQLSKINGVEITLTSSTPYLDHYHDLLKNIDVVFLDIEMPEIDGLALAEQLNEQYPHIHIVFVSAYKGYAIEAFELSALDYLLKPVKLDRLKKTINRIEQQLPLNSSINNSNKHLLIQVLGPLEFILDDNLITNTIQWRTSKSKEVFLFLLHHAGAVLSKSRIVETLWPDIDPDKGFANLYVNIYNVRKSLKQLKNFITITNVDNGYAIKLRHTDIDKQLWYAFFKKNFSLHDAIPLDYQHHLDMYKGFYLEELDYIWAEAERFEIDESWVHHAKLLADFYFNNNDIEQASRWYTTIIKRRPDDEQVAFQLMKLYADLNYRMLVEHQYKDLQKNLHDLNVSMDTTIKNWFAEWQRQFYT